MPDLDLVQASSENTTVFSFSDSKPPKTKLSNSDNTISILRLETSDRTITDESLSSDNSVKSNTVNQNTQISDRRQLRIDNAASNRIGGVRIVLENLTNQGNRAAILRSVEALGFLYVEEIITKTHNHNTVTTQQWNLDSNNFSSDIDQNLLRRRTESRSIVNGAEKWLQITRHSSVTDFMKKMHSESNYIKVLAAMPPPLDQVDSVEGQKSKKFLSHTNLEDIDFRNYRNLNTEMNNNNSKTSSNSNEIALVFGSEGLGISKELQRACDGTFSVPMFGLTESLNVSVTVAICAHHARIKRLEILNLNNNADVDSEGLAVTRPNQNLKTDLSNLEIEALKEEYMRRSLDHNFVKKVKIQRREENDNIM